MKPAQTEAKSGIDATRNVEAARPHAGGHHARFLPPDVPVHVISRVFQGRHLLRPCKQLNDLIVGVMARGRLVYPGVRIYAVAFMSNHVHWLLQGPTREVPAFIGYVKREISRRWGSAANVGWEGTMWHEYVATALPTAESQEHCLEYILSQGVKEGLVDSPEQWPGVGSARALRVRVPLRGEWFDGSAYARARDVESRKVHPAAVRRNNYFQRAEVWLDPLPAWTDRPVEQQRAEITAMIVRIVGNARRSRGGKRPLGANAVRRVSLHRRTSLPAPPWFEHRRRMICWDNPRRPEVQAFLARYWIFQEAFRAASDLFCGGNRMAEFPDGAFKPPSYSPPANSN